MLPSHMQYDWGLRTRMAIVRLSSNAAHRDTALLEATAVLESTRRVLGPSLAPADRTMLDGILADVFPECRLPCSAADAFDDALTEACKEIQLQMPEQWFAKVRALCCRLLVRIVDVASPHG